MFLEFRLFRFFDGTIREFNNMPRIPLRSGPCSAPPSGWILAGGRSSRMGTDKASLEIEGVPLLQRVARQMRQVCNSVSVIGDPARYRDSGLPAIPDNFHGAGPLAGIEAALGATVSDSNLIVACDMPSATAAVFEALFESGGDIALPRHADGKLEPLCGVYSRRCHAHVRRMLESGVRRATEALRLLQEDGFALRYLAVTEAGAFVNLNTPDDLARYRQERPRG